MLKCEVPSAYDRDIKATEADRNLDREVPHRLPVPSLLYLGGAAGGHHSAPAGSEAMAAQKRLRVLEVLVRIPRKSLPSQKRRVEASGICVSDRERLENSSAWCPCHELRHAFVRSIVTMTLSNG